ncbi:transglycosylase SLT domain-containing protein [Gluconacetobacter diazotrophicus]|uniref:transglycosylase SLT domain-containing protein n=1 Tax=Gluconacetobacter diazotrophicus TaxID=33996 RepID=UPI00287B954C|nr:transglycosylase SLT domain-containing protein [Gluconacetobacter diazotrophicus]
MACLALFGATLFAVPAAAVPEEVIPSIPEVGTPTITTTASSSVGESDGTSGSSVDTSYTGAWGSTNATQTLLSESYGSQAVADATAAGINPDTLAAFGQIESQFQNTGNSSSSASGVWQITDATWDQYASQLGLSDADRSDPAVQAQVASAIISSYASSVASATGTSPTSEQVYGAYMFGTSAGSKIATASADAPLSNFVSATALANNNMTGWTVGQYYATVAKRMGSGASEAAITA